MYRAFIRVGFACLIVLFAVQLGACQKKMHAPSDALTPFERHGKLQVCGQNLCAQTGKPVQLRGISTHGLQWYGWSNCLTPSSLDLLAKDWQVDIVRIALYVNEGGYASDPEAYFAQLNTLVDELSKRGLYVLIDWHILKPGDPMLSLDLAATFFERVTERHQEKNNILYEIVNEPNGVSWLRVKAYADKIIPLIRAYNDDAVVIVGSPAWSSLGLSEQSSHRDILAAPIEDANTMYSFHFYAASHGEKYLEELSKASEHLPIFVTEWGAQLFTGDKENNFAMAQRYLDYMDSHKISWVYWNFSDDKRLGAVMVPGACKSERPWSEKALKASGDWIKLKF